MDFLSGDNPSRRIPNRIKTTRSAQACIQQEIGEYTAPMLLCQCLLAILCVHESEQNVSIVFRPCRLMLLAQPNPTNISKPPVGGDLEREGEPPDTADAAALAVGT